MNAFASLLAALILSGPATSQITIPAENPRDSLIVGSFSATIPEGATVEGGFEQSSDAFDYRKSSDGTLYLAGAPGKHWLEFEGYWVHTRERTFKDGDGNTITINEFLGSGFVKDRSDFTILGAVDPVPPPIPPEPQPGPGGPWKVWFLENPEQRDNLPKKQANLLTSLKFREDLKYLGHQFQELVSDNVLANPPARLEQIANASSGKPLPGLVIASLAGDGEYQWFPLPESYEALAKLLDETEK